MRVRDFQEAQRDVPAGTFGTFANRETRGSRENTAGFTLIEVLISAALMALILVCAYACLSACLSSQKMIEPRADVLQNARVAMTLMSADLRNACPLSSDYALLGMQRMLGDVEADNVDFATHNYTPRQPQESDYCEVSYFVDKDQAGQMCLYRRRNPTLAPDPLSGGSREEIAEGVMGVRFEYFDGTDWYDKWGNAENPEQTVGLSEEQLNEKGLPEAVRITLMLDSDPQPRSKPAVNNGAESSGGTPLVFQTVVRLMLAEQANGADGGNSAASF
ncbi:MAG TPA: type II secretion system protein GspJ [Verrucomicrobiae bacterium]|nr:type II secretion system protein GspJ [Verrucomicrobiae bacterium]